MFKYKCEPIWRVQLEERHEYRWGSFSQEEPEAFLVLDTEDKTNSGKYLYLSPTIECLYIEYITKYIKANKYKKEEEKYPGMCEDRKEYDRQAEQIYHKLIDKLRDEANHDNAYAICLLKAEEIEKMLKGAFNEAWELYFKAKYGDTKSALELFGYI